MPIDWSTLLLQLVNFLVLAWLLQRLLFRPVRRVIEERRRVTEAALAEANAEQAKAKAAEAELATRLAALEGERQAVRRQLHDELEAERRAALEAAQNEAAKLVEAAQARLADERQETLTALKVETVELAVALARTILARVDPAPLTESLLATAAAHLDQLPAADMERLRGDLADPGLLVVTPQPMPASAAATWRDRLVRRLGETTRVAFAAEPELLAGVELRLPHARLSFSLADLLARAREELVQDARAA
jgi:F-type H+-transporting ATPase subunit b